MERVVISGRGLVTPLGNGLAKNIEALREGRSGTVFMPEWKEWNLDSVVAGISDHEPPCPLVTIKNQRFMTANSRMAMASAYEALLEAGLTLETLPKGRTAMIHGCAGSAYGECWQSMKNYDTHHKVKRISPCSVPRVMPSSAVSNMSLLFGITGESYDISCACTSSAMCVVLATRLIQSGLYDIVFAGGSEELSWSQALGFCAMRALSRAYNETPGKASRPFDRDRDGFVLSEGAGILILESESHARARGFKPKGRISGVAANSNAHDMVVPDAESSATVMRMSIENAGLKPEDIAYINTHGTATPVGDPVEMDSIHRVFNGKCRPAINSTKSMTGHMLGATGAVEAIFTSIMCEQSFISPSINLDNPEEAFAWADLVREPRIGVEVRHALSNSFAFGGSNACIVMSRWED